MKLRFFSVMPAVFALLILVFGCKKSDDSNSGNNNNNNNNSGATVNIPGMSFSPASLTVKVGTKVNWTNNDAVAHTATSDDDSTFNTGSIAPGASASFTPNKTGSFPYHCDFHSNMKATLIVTN